MPTAWPDRIRVTGANAHLLLGFAQEESELSLDDVERVVNVVVVMPGHLLTRRDLELVYTKAGTLGMMSPSLDFIEMARVFEGFHGLLQVGGAS